MNLIRRPAVMASYIASVCLQDDHEAISIIEGIKTRSADSVMLSNNHAFALASLDRVEEAENVLSGIHEIELNDRESNTLLATKGLIEFRKGNVNQGRGMYKKAILGFKKAGYFYSAAIAAAFRAREEMLIHSEFEKDALRDAIKLAKKYEVKELLPYTSSLASRS